MKYLAYGMNTSSQQMMLRCPGAVSFGPAYVPNYKLVCRYHFDIDPCENHIMQAVLWDIPDDTLQNLDALEGYPYYYNRIIVTAYTDQSLTKSVNAYIYIMTDESKLEGYRDPNTQYLNSVQVGYQEHGLDMEQIQSYIVRDLEPNLAEDLLNDQQIGTKVRASRSYAQNLYAALCNTEWQKLDMFPILKDQRWRCSWRSAGGIVAKIRQEGDYIDWYCSGIRNISYDEEYNIEWDIKKYVTESNITSEVEKDLKRLGWICVAVHV